MNDIMVHAITDGRDTSPTGGAAYLEASRNEACADWRADRDGHRPLLRDGPRQTLGAQQARVGRNRPRPRRADAASHPAPR